MDRGKEAVSENTQLRKSHAMTTAVTSVRDEGGCVIARTAVPLPENAPLMVRRRPMRVSWDVAAATAAFTPVPLE